MPFIGKEFVAALPNSAVPTLVKHQFAVSQRVDTGGCGSQSVECRLKRRCRLGSAAVCVCQRGVAELRLLHTLARC